MRKRTEVERVAREIDEVLGGRMADERLKELARWHLNSLPGLNSEAFLTKERLPIEEAIVVAKRQGDLFGGTLTEDGKCDDGVCFV